MALPLRSAFDRVLLRFLGRRFVTASVVSFAAAFLGAVVDYWFAIAIQIFLFSMGLLTSFAAPFALPEHNQPLVVGGILIALGALRALFQFLQGFGAGVAQEHTSARVRATAILRILPRDDGPRLAANEAFFIYSEVSAKAALYLQNVVRFLSSVVQTAVLGAAMLYLSWDDCLIAGGLLVVCGLGLLRLNLFIGQAAKLNPLIWTDSVAAMESASRNWFYIRIKHIHESERTRLQQLNGRVLAIGFRLRRLSEVSPAAVGFVAVLMLGVLTDTRARLTHTSPAVFLSFLYVFLRFAQGLGESARYGSGLIEFGPYLDRLRALLGTLSPEDAQLGRRVDDRISYWGRALETAPASPPPGEALVRPELTSPPITLRGVWFRYAETTPWILRGLDTDVAAGSQLAIVGPSGCGKSTLLALILGFLKPGRGAIDIAGQPPETFCAREAEYIGYVGPDPYIVTGSVRDNVRFGSRGVYADDEVWRALEQASLADVIRALPAGLDTPIRHHDVSLSMGQRQRLALARALLSSPLLLVLDEASANLDDATEQSIAQSIRALKGTTTTIIVSHKLGLVKFADRVIDLGARPETP